MDNFKLNRINDHVIIHYEYVLTGLCLHDFFYKQNLKENIECRVMLE